MSAGYTTAQVICSKWIFTLSGTLSFRAHVDMDFCPPNHFIFWDIGPLSVECTIYMYWNSEWFFLTDLKSQNKRVQHIRGMQPMPGGPWSLLRLVFLGEQVLLASRLPWGLPGSSVLAKLQDRPLRHHQSQARQDTEDHHQDSELISHWCCSCMTRATFSMSFV